MSLNLTTIKSMPSVRSPQRSEASAPTNYPRLDPTVWRDRLLGYRTLKSDRKEVDRQARELKKIADASRDVIVEALAGSPIAQCGDLMVTVKTGGDALPSITLKNGRKISLADIKTLVLSNGAKVPADEVSAIYGGRSGSTDVEVIG